MGQLRNPEESGRLTLSRGPTKPLIRTRLMATGEHGQNIIRLQLLK